jgi:hypothetical protein
MLRNLEGADDLSSSPGDIEFQVLQTPNMLYNVSTMYTIWGRTT